MQINSFEDLIMAAAMQAQPQRLLIAFAVAEAEPDPEPGAAGRTTLVPVMCVDKQVGELDTYANLVEEAQAMGQHWDVMLISTLSGQNGVLPDPQRTDAALNQMLGHIQQGQMDRMLAFDRSGDMLRYH
ncbi:hypothetical protein ACFFKC_20550 [Pseudoduganella danionis]|uniref:Uncharacterized protein n=1 Tax=Pseudoduganella danionis TaxID=1890295 RepID=A0ABW9SRP9_9BURK|nr:hypothetical protein [Pseudoduganella danionis]MTW34500.1 hypothetical protein [Pseudoduganella danionis]